MVEFISLHRNTLVPGPESDTVYTGEVITQVIGGTTEPEIIQRLRWKLATTARPLEGGSL